MNAVLVCTVLFVGGIAAPTDTEECYVQYTAQEVDSYCRAALSFAFGQGRKLTFCRPFDGRVAP